MSNVFVLDAKKRPLDPIHPGRARILLAEGKAAVLKRYPFTIILKIGIEKPEVHPLRIKVDPGSQTTGIALLNDTTGEVVFAAELSDRLPLLKTQRSQKGQGLPDRGYSSSGSHNRHETRRLRGTSASPGEWIF